MKTKTMTPEQIVAEYRKRVNPAPCADRVLDFARAMLWDRRGFTTATQFRVHPNFPLRGSLSFTRDGDGKRCSLTLRGNKWKGVAK